LLWRQLRYPLHTQLLLLYLLWRPLHPRLLQPHHLLGHLSHLGGTLSIPTHHLLGHLLLLKLWLELLWLLLLESTTQPTYTTTRSVTDLHLTSLYAEDAERHIC
jgi:hypothetical protein